MNNKIIYIPLDERPCNYEYPKMIIDISDIEMLMPPIKLLGKKKQPADIDKLLEWMEENIIDASHLIVSIDMMLYGGIVPSRLHKKTLYECMQRLEKLKNLKRNNPQLKIYAFNLIMRTPSYNRADEEPDYYEFYGEKIFEYGVLSDKVEQNCATDDEKTKMQQLYDEIPQEIFNDYLNRRNINHKINLKVIDMVKEGLIDFMVIPMDDCSKYGFSVKERRDVIKHISTYNVSNRTYSYPGADEIGCILTARAFNDIKDNVPSIFTRFSSETGKVTIPLLEDRSLYETTKYQIIAAGGIMADNSLESDFILMVNTPSEITLKVADSWQSFLYKNDIGDPERNLNEFIEAINYNINRGRHCAVADVAFLNGSDNELMKLLKDNKLFKKLLSYGGWNTSSNTLGTVISHSIVLSYYINKKELTTEKENISDKFLFLRYLEDWGYQHFVRAEVAQNLNDFWLDYFNLGDKADIISKLIRTKLYQFKADNLNEFDYDFDVYMPWNRMFEVGIKLKEKNS